MIASWGGAGYTARAVARVGRLMLRRGNWEGTQIIGTEAVRLVTSDAGTPGNSGLGWWSNNDAVYAGIPKDALRGSSAGHQVVLIVPSLKLGRATPPVSRQNRSAATAGRSTRIFR